MSSTEELAERWLAGETLSAEEQAALRSARRRDPGLDRELTDLLRLDARFTASASGDQRLRSAHDAVWASIEPELGAQPNPALWSSSRRWLILGGFAVAAVVAGLIAWQPPSSVPRYALNVDGGERTILGGEHDTGIVRLAPDTALRIVLQPDRATQVVRVQARWIQGERSEPVVGDWELSSTGSVRLVGLREDLAPKWTGRVLLRVQVQTTAGASTGVERSFTFVDP